MSWNLVCFGLPKKDKKSTPILALSLGVVMVDAATGSGKSTLVPLCLAQQCLEDLKNDEFSDEFSGKGWRSKTNERAALLSESSICIYMEWGVLLGIFINLFINTFQVHVILQLFSLVWDLLSWMFLFLFLFCVSCFDTAIFIQIDFHVYSLPLCASKSYKGFIFNQDFFCTFYVLKLICSSFTLFSDSHDIFDSWVTFAQKENRGCRIVVTQPRRIAAKGLATRVSQQAEGSSWKVLHGKWSIIKWYFWIFLDGIRIPSKMAAILSRWLDRLWNDL